MPGWSNSCSPGVHGLLLCHAETPGAVKIFVEAARYPFQSLGVGKGIGVARRGADGQSKAPAIWGLPWQEYVGCTNVWLLNPNGELMLGLKIENRRALENVEPTLKVPGIALLPIH